MQSFENLANHACIFFITQGYIVVPSEKRFLVLFTFLKKNRNKKVMVFFSSCNSVKYHYELLNYIDLPVVHIHVSAIILVDLFNESPSNYNLRNSDFFVHRINSVKFWKHSLRYFGPFLWSKLLSKNKAITSLSAFIANIRRENLTTLSTDGRCTNCHLCNL